MNKNKITLKIDSNKITAKEFKESVDSFLDLIDCVANNLSGGNKCIEQFISVEKGSAILNSDIKPIGDKNNDIPGKVIDIISNGFTSLENDEETLPEYFNIKVLILAKKIAKSKNIKIIPYKKPEISITSNTVLSIDAILKEEYCDLGSIDGVIQTISTRKGFKVNIYEGIRDIKVECKTENKDIEDILKSSIDRRVSAYGYISYTKFGLPKKINIKEIKILRDKGLPTWEEVRGILND